MECGVKLQGGDLHARMVNETTEPVVGVGFGCNNMVDEREMWLNNDQDDLLGNMNDDASMFYADFPPLPDFPCMSSSSSSSSSSSTPTMVPLKTIACSDNTTTTTTTTTSSSSSGSSSSAASWALLKSDFEEDGGERNKSHGGGYMQHLDLLDHNQHAALSSTASMEISQQQQPDHHALAAAATVNGDCMVDDVIMDTFGYMELLEANDFFDPSSIFQNEEENPLEFTQNQVPHHEEHHHQHLNQHAIVMHDSESKPQQGIEEDQGVPVCEEEIQGEELGGGGVDGFGGDDELSMVFLEWLKSNKDSVSANDLRNVKLKKSTIESAARRLGGGKEGMKQLLKLILQWVQTSHLQNKRRKENNNINIVPSDLLLQQQQQFQDPCQNQNTNSFGPDHQSNTCFNQTQWLSQPPPFGATTDQAPPLIVAPPPPPPAFSQPMVGYVGDPFTDGGATSNNMNGYQPAAPTTSEYQHMLESTHSWGPSSQFSTVPSSHYNNQSFGDNNLLQPVAGFGGGYGNQYPYQFFHGPGDRLMRLGPSATKEARKKRMARQRRFLSHHRHHQNQGSDPHARLGSDSCNTVVAASHANPASWMYWQTMAGGAASLAPVVPAEPPQQPLTQNCHQGRVSSDRRQGWKPEKNLRFLLQKVLKQSDVGSLGRIVLPKKEAETHLPELEARDGISITMEDIGTSRVWNMRYRYWPNNKSRMYLLENTGDFVKANGLQEGDFIVIYSDVKCGKFMIRGVKVRQQGAKPEAKKTGKSQKNQHGNNAATTAGTDQAHNGTPSSSPKRKTEKIVN